VISKLPFEFPQEGWTIFELVITSSAGCVIVTVAEVVQPLASDAVTV